MSDDDDGDGRRATGDDQRRPMTMDDGDGGDDDTDCKCDDGGAPRALSPPRRLWHHGGGGGGAEVPPRGRARRGQGAADELSDGAVHGAEAHAQPAAGGRGTPRGARPQRTIRVQDSINWRNQVLGVGHDFGLRATRIRPPHAVYVGPPPSADVPAVDGCGSCPAPALLLCVFNSSDESSTSYLAPCVPIGGQRLPEPATLG